MKEKMVERESQEMNWLEKEIINCLIALCLALFWVAVGTFARKFLFPDLEVKWILVFGVVVFVGMVSALTVLQRWGWHTDDEG